MTKVALGSDHAGFDLKGRLGALLAELGFESVDFGTHSSESSDYPDYGHAVSGAVSSGECQLGVLVCGSGIGMSMTANRHAGVRAALAWSEEVGEMARRHNDANVLVLPARFIDEGTAVDILKKFLQTSFEGGRHERRVKKIDMGQSAGEE
jgi:ribose 5-phosphate isomerase B